MSDVHLKKLSQIDLHLGQIAEQGSALLSERKTLVIQHENMLAQDFNL